jgi:hypothetical protein
MTNFKRITEARLRSNRIREHAAAFRSESAYMDESIKETRKSAIPVVIRRKSSSKNDHVVPVGRVA